MDTLRILLLAPLWAFVFTPAFGQALNVTSGSMAFTASLLLLGFAGLAVLGWRRKHLPTFLPAG